MKNQKPSHTSAHQTLNTIYPKREWQQEVFKNLISKNFKSFFRGKLIKLLGWIKTLCVTDKLKHFNKGKSLSSSSFKAL